MRRPPPEGLKQGEIILNERAQDELLPHFITSQTRAWRDGLAAGGSAGRIDVLRRARASMRFPHSWSSIFIGGSG